MTFWSPIDPKRPRATLRSQRYAEGLCEQCGVEPRRPGKRMGVRCAEMARVRDARRDAERRLQLRGPRVPHHCGTCGEVGHSSKTCRPEERADPRYRCLRCRHPPRPGSLYCAEHERWLAELAAEGWREEDEG